MDGARGEKVRSVEGPNRVARKCESGCMKRDTGRDECNTECCETIQVALETIQADTGVVGIWEITGCVGGA